MNRNDDDSVRFRLDLLWATVVSRNYLDAVVQTHPTQAADSAVKLADQAEDVLARRLSPNGADVLGDGKRRLDCVWALVAATRWQSQLETGRGGPMTVDAERVAAEAAEAVEAISKRPSIAHLLSKPR